MAEFEVDIDQFVKKAKGHLQEGPRAIAEALTERVKELTPVVTGRLRAGWQLERTDDGWVISNNVEYAQRINFGFTGQDKLGRHYDQSGAHFVEQTLAEADEIAKNALKGLS